MKPIPSALVSYYKEVKGENHEQSPSRGSTRSVTPSQLQITEAIYRTARRNNRIRWTATLGVLPITALAAITVYQLLGQGWVSEVLVRYFITLLLVLWGTGCVGVYEFLTKKLPYVDLVGTAKYQKYKRTH